MRQRVPAVSVLVCAGALALGACGGQDDGGRPHDRAGGGASAEASPTADDFGCLTGAQTAKSVTFPSAQGAEVSGYEAGTGTTGLVLSHQSDNNVCSWITRADELARSGYRVLAVDSDGSEVAEIQGAVRRLRGEGVRKVMLMGASKGGTASLVAAASVRPPVAAVVFLSGPGVYNGMDATAAVPHLSVPVLLVAAQGDDRFASDARELDKLARRSTDEKLEIVPGTAHGNQIVEAQPSVWDEVKAFLARHR